MSAYPCRDRLAVWADEIAAALAALVLLGGLSLSAAGAFGPVPEAMGRRALRRLTRRMEAEETAEAYHACADSADGWAEHRAVEAAKR